MLNPNDLSESVKFRGSVADLKFSEDFEDFTDLGDFGLLEPCCCFVRSRISFEICFEIAFFFSKFRGRV